MYTANTKDVFRTDLSADVIASRYLGITITKMPIWYNCEAYISGSVYTIEDILKAWGDANGLRRSHYIPDRVSAQVQFEVFEILENIINKHTTIISEAFKNHMHWNTKDVKINILGTVAQNVATQPRCGVPFAAEWIIGIRYFLPSYRFHTFQPQDATCRQKFYNKRIEVSEADAIQLARQESPTPSTVFPSAIPLKPAPFAPSLVGGNPNIEEPIFSDIPEDKNNPVFEVFFTNKDNDKYTFQSPEITKLIKEFSKMMDTETTTPLLSTNANTNANLNKTTLGGKYKKKNNTKKKKNTKRKTNKHKKNTKKRNNKYKYKK
jgi:hypothetical protein